MSVSWRSPLSLRARSNFIMAYDAVVNTMGSVWVFVSTEFVLVCVESVCIAFSDIVSVLTLSSIMPEAFAATPIV